MYSEMEFSIADIGFPAILFIMPADDRIIENTDASMSMESMSLNSQGQAAHPRLSRRQKGFLTHHSRAGKKNIPRPNRMSSKYDYEFDYDFYYCYPQSHVLRRQIRFLPS